MIGSSSRPAAVKRYSCPRPRGAARRSRRPACSSCASRCAKSVVSSTGAAGLTLGGGFGWLARRHGLAADDLLSAELVGAEGRLLVASGQENPGLFLGLRGGGGNFGIATSFEFRLHRLGPEVLFGPTLYRLEDAAQVLRAYRDFAVAAPRDCCIWADLLTAPALPFLPERYHGAKVPTLLQFWAGPMAAGETLLAELRGFAQPIAEAVGRTPYTAAQSLLDASYAKGARNYLTSRNFTQLSDGVIDALVEAAAAGGSYVNFIAEARGREQEAYGANYGRLAALKQRYDPGNFFRLNQNVKPAAGAPGSTGA